MARMLEGFTPEQVHEMWTKPGIDDWFEFLQERAPSRHWEIHGSVIKGLCPWHQDTTPSLEFNVANKSIRCFPCDKYTRDLLPFLAEIANTSVEELYYELAQRFKYKTSPEMADRLRYETTLSELKRKFVQICTKALTSAFNSEDGFEYGLDTVRYLQSRNVNLNLVVDFGIGMMPTRGQVFRELPERLQKDFDEYFGDHFNKNPNVQGRHGGWVVLPFYTTTAKVGRIKLKPPNREKHPIWIGPDKTERRGFFGLNMYRTLLDSSSGEHSSRVVIVEGEMDQLAFQQAQIENHPGDQIPVIAGSGGSAEDIGMLKHAGVKHVTIMGDHDKGGHSFIKTILGEASQDKLHRISVFDWGHRYNAGTDPDEVIQNGKYAKLRRDVLNTDYLLEPFQWASGRVEEVFRNSADMTVKSRVELAVKFGEVLHDEIDFDLYQNECAEILDVNPALLEKHTTDIESEEGFVRAIERALNRVIKPLVVFKKKLIAYLRKDRATKDIPFSPNRAWASTLSACLGMPIYNWVEKYVGIPDHIAIKVTKQGPQPVGLERKMSQTETFFKFAFERLIATARLSNDLKTKRQGYHFISADDPIAEVGLAPEEPRQRHYLVNGRDILIGTEVGDELRWRQAELPIHGAYFFDALAEKRWSQHVSIPNLEDAVLAPPDEKYSEINAAITHGFRFVDGSLIRQAMTYYIMTATVLTAFPSMTQLFFTATTRSGKSTLMLGVLSRRKYPKITMLEMSVGEDDYSSAGVMQQGAGSSMLVCLDEFEDPEYADSSRKKGVFNDLLVAMRNMDTGAERVRGTPSQQAKQVSARFPVVCAGIHPFQNAVDANRFITIEMDHTPGHVAPDVSLVSKFGSDFFEEIRKWTTLYPIRHVQTYQKLYAELEKEILESGKIEFTSSRSARLVLPMTVVSKLCGHDYLQFAQDLIDLIEKRLSASSVSEEEALFRAVFQTNAITIENKHIRHSVISILADGLERVHLESSDLGVYWIPDTDVAVLYPNKLPELLRRNPQFRNMTNTNQIYQLLSRHPLVHNDQTFFLKNPNVIEYLTKRVAKPRYEELLYVKLSDMDFWQANKVHPAGLDEM